MARTWEGKKEIERERKEFERDREEIERGRKEIEQDREEIKRRHQGQGGAAAPALGFRSREPHYCKVR